MEQKFITNTLSTYASKYFLSWPICSTWVNVLNDLNSKQPAVNGENFELQPIPVKTEQNSAKFCFA